MACPDFQSLTLPMLQCAAIGGDMTLAILRDKVAVRLGLTDADVAEVLPSGKQRRYVNRGNWACIYMAEAGLLEWVRRGTYRITARGREVVAKPPARIDVAYLMQFPEFRAWKQGSAEATDGASVTPLTAIGSSPPTSADEETPEEKIEAAYLDLRSTVERELILKILAAPPVFFENLVVELLLAMGYGRLTGRRGRGSRPLWGRAASMASSTRTGLASMRSTCRPSAGIPPSTRFRVGCPVLRGQSRGLPRAQGRLHHDDIILIRGARLRRAHREAHRSDRRSAACRAPVRSRRRRADEGQLRGQGSRRRILPRRLSATAARTENSGAGSG